MEDKQIQDLIDRNDIIDVFSRYAIGIDQKDRAHYRACFTDELEWDVTGQGFQRGKAEEWVETAMSAVGGFRTTQHIITNHTIDVDGDDAVAVAYLQAQHWNPESSMLVGGYYTNKLKRTSDGWRIAQLKLTISWTEMSQHG